MSFKYPHNIQNYVDTLMNKKFTATGKYTNVSSLCSECYGQGKVIYDLIWACNTKENKDVLAQCPRCDGSGKRHAEMKEDKR